MLQQFLSKNYLIYGSSIIISRGLEFFVIFYAAFVLSKDLYGEFEYYKKLIETFSIGFAFGFPSLIMSYTRGNRNKDYFYILALIFVLLLGILGFWVALLFNKSELIIPFLFYSLFFTGSITQTYILVRKGSNSASVYKIIISLLFFSTIFLFLQYFHLNEKSLIYACYLLFPLQLLYVGYQIRVNKINFYALKKYAKLFRRLLYGSITMVVSDFANILFLYTDIFIIKLLSKSPHTEIANFSFALNIGTLMLIIPTTILQVNIEKLKSDQYNQTKILNKKITFLILGFSLFIILFYKLFTEFIFIAYKETFILFIFIVIAKIFQSQSNLFGTNLLILRKFNLNLIINVVFLIINIILCLILYKPFGLYGIVISSIISLSARNFLLMKLSYKYLKPHNVHT